MSDGIKKEMLVVHEEMAQAIEEWSREVDLDALAPESRDALVSVFRDGYGACLNRTLRPAVDLSMILLQMIALQRARGANDFRVSAEALASLEGLCHKIAGIPEQWQLDDAVEPVEAGAHDEVSSPEEKE